MAEAFGFYADNIVTRDYLDAVLRSGFGEHDRRLEQIEQRLEKLEPLRIQTTLHSFMLGLIVLVQVVPQLQVWLAP
ncbi:hypothetical protein [Kineobactrum salinum]|uniref:Uncharacterized protein n=1 Tax=Kineobactrum salinum TaxID=2708301 RepID=A0A6C0U533_9GAMM|nr:hypothetical protein [Kineobactrum salinum]QIB67038.1 hypothetical protein G3T16_18215 [Kineobactrum salinum]